ncbi:MAG: Hsp20/alpha crystallin family protein [Planctomycetes bacterium]|nr:Hsp20/alpha crystallin family protein [Planctomycetota bacterium]
MSDESLDSNAGNASNGTTSNEPDRSSDGMPPLDRVRQEMERWLDVARTTGERALESLGLVAGGRPAEPAIDVVELDSEVVVLVDLPGVSAEAVQLSLVGNMLTVKAARSGCDFPESTRRHVFERTVTEFERAIPLPAAVDLDEIRAETRDGLLTVTIRKLSATGRSIPVARAGGASKPADTI